MKKNNGFSVLLVVILVVIVAIGVLAGSYFMVNKDKLYPVGQNSYSLDKSTPLPLVSPDTVSEKDDLETISQELELTVEGSVTNDLNTLDQEASGL